AKFPNDLAFVQADCDLAARRGDLTRAVAITQEMDKLAKNAPNGPLNRARIYAAEGRTREAAAAFDEALQRNPRLLDVRIRLGQTRLKLGEVDEAIRQAKVVLDVNGNQPDALLLEAQALASQGDDDRQKDQSRAQAIALLNGAIVKQPGFAAAYHEVALLQKQRGQRAESVATLKKNLKELPNDALGLTLAVEYLTERHADGTPASDEELKDAAALASETDDRDKKGLLALAVAIGYQKAGQLSLAVPWAEKAIQKSDTAAPHLNYGDLLLSLAEAARDAATAKRYFEQAVEQYDLVLKVQANSVEAINNKAWIMHAHLGQGKKALELVQGLVSRVDPAILPPEVFDTLGAILEEQGKARDAEEAYNKGLRKAPDHPVLNFHMGRLIAADKGRAGKAARYLEKANAGRDRLAPTMVEDLDKLTGKLGVTQAR
ncbi:MAG: tetratricopeptide repeat protein, partial [Isosphaeraceae bacterium]|nr:tetratricopeptide repeat protein [Isosphaeraceae bacterium]